MITIAKFLRTPARICLCLTFSVHLAATVRAQGSNAVAEGVKSAPEATAKSQAQLGANAKRAADMASAPQQQLAAGAKRATESVARSQQQLTQGANKITDAARSRGAFLGVFRFEVPDLAAAAKVGKIEIDPRVTSPRTLTYKSRLSRVSRWIGPLTLGLLNYVPFETMNAEVSGRMNNLMAEEKISVEQLAARVFGESLAQGKRFRLGEPSDAVMSVEVNRYALDPVPTSLGRMKPTVSLTGRLRSPQGRLLWIGKGFSTIAESTIKGATVEQYEENPDALRAEFEEATRVAARRLAAQANMVPKAKVTVVPDDR
jgi:hypothetical protein